MVIGLAGRLIGGVGEKLSRGYGADAGEFGEQREGADEGVEASVDGGDARGWIGAVLRWGDVFYTLDVGQDFGLGGFVERAELGDGFLEFFDAEGTSRVEGGDKQGVLGILQMLHGVRDVRLAAPGESIAEWEVGGLAEVDEIALGANKSDEPVLIYPGELLKRIMFGFHENKIRRLLGQCKVFLWNFAKYYRVMVGIWVYLEGGTGFLPGVFDSGS